jgi:hypothetical protein
LSETTVALISADGAGIIGHMRRFGGEAKPSAPGTFTRARVLIQLMAAQRCSQQI